MKSLIVMTAGLFGFLFIGSQFSHADANLTICAKQGHGWFKGYVLDGVHATYTDWQTNKIIGEMIGDGNCESGWTMITEIDPRITGVSSASTGRSTHGGVSSTSVETVAAGRMTSAYNGTAPVVLKGQANGANDKWKLVSEDGNGGGTYKVVKPGNTSRPKGTELHFTADMLVARDNQSGNATVNEYWQRNYRYGAVRDLTTTDTTEKVRTVNYNRTHTFCPSTYKWIFVSPEGQAVAVTNSKVYPCRTKTSTVRREVVSRTPASSVTVAGDKYIQQ